jgi:hypothetical protein
MPVGMVHVGHMRVRVTHRRMLVEMRVRLAGRIERAVRMAMVLVMNMRMGVRHRLVPVLVRVLLGQVQPHADRHQDARALPRNGAVEK